MASKIKLIAGLGNPGKVYLNSRHNFGFLAVTELAKRNGLKFKRSLLFKSSIAQGEVGGQETVLVLPLTFMNSSGGAVRHLIVSKKIDLKNILVVCDDINLELGVLRLRPSGSDGGHNGLKSIISTLSSQDFNRLRLGIAGEKRIKDMVEFVLSDFDRKEKSTVSKQIERAVECCVSWLSEGVVKTMDKFNKG
ncbi:MAG: aminoacyl-tRNA hydrolase [Candidatus Omnitrophota bacterium]|nr:aminoacyl-tRNA hydrolase [Candidatus Omnitrophota bacterium]